MDRNSKRNEIKIWFRNLWELVKKIYFEEQHSNYLVVSVSTRFLRDWIVSRYLDEILKIVKNQIREISRIEFRIEDKEHETDKAVNNIIKKDDNISFLKDSFLQYNRIDQNKSFDNFIIGASNKLAFEASKKVSENISLYNPLYIYGGVGMGKTHLLNAIGLNYRDNKKIMFIVLKSSFPNLRSNTYFT